MTTDQLQESRPQNSSLLDTVETSVQKPSHTSYQQWLVRENPAEWESTMQLYERLDLEQHKDYALRLSWCSVMAWFVRNSEDGHVRVASRKCRLRWCPICSRARARVITHSVKDWVAGLKRPKFLTLTLQHSNAPLEHQIDHLYKSFRKLRLSNRFKKLVRGGVWFFQIKQSSTDKQWHPHLHCIIDAEYIEQAWLSDKWLKITLTSNIVDIRACHDPDKAAEYVARYAARPSSLDKLGPEHQLELFDTMHGRRLCGSWGNAKGLQLRPKPAENVEKWKRIGAFSLVTELKNSSSCAKQIYKAWLMNLTIPIDCTLTNFEFATENKINEFIDNISYKEFRSVFLEEP